MEIITNQPRPSVFEYSDYRAFLRDLYTHLKAKHQYFSFRYFSRRAGFKSPNFLKLAIEGKRNLSVDSIGRFTEALSLSRAEGDFFAQLVMFNQSKSSTEKSDCAKKLLLFRGLQQARPLQQAEFSYYANWYYIPVREAVVLKNFRESAAWIAPRIFPRITEEQAACALRDLELLGLLVRNQDGQLVQAERTVTTSNEVTSSAVAEYHKTMMQKASDSIDEVPRERREISAACVPISEKTAAKFKKLIQAFRQEILTLAAEDDEAEVIYQLNIQLFPMSQWNSGDKS